MLKIAICDDEEPIREYLKQLTQRLVNADIAVFANGEELLSDKTAYDIILLDISFNNNNTGMLRNNDGANVLNNNAETGMLNGMETAGKIRQKSDAIIIFVTAFKEYVFEGYDVGAFNYLLKPIDELKFKEVIDKAVSQINRKKNNESLLIKVGGDYINVSVNNIIYAENEARKIILHTKNMKEKTYRFYEKMEVLERKLGNNFFRTHRGFLVNLQEIVRYDNTSIELKNGDTVFLSKQKYNDFVTAYMNYLRRA